MKAGWKVKPLGELCRIEIGSTPARGNGHFWDDGKATNNVWLSIADLPRGTQESAFDSKEYVSDVAAESMKMVSAGTLLVSFKLTLGRLAYAGVDLFTNEAIAALYINDEERLDQRFLYWALAAFDWDKAAEGDVKVKGKTLNKAKLKLLPITLPPLEEQKGIVSVLDEAFEGLDRARANAEANLADARELFGALTANLFQLESSWSSIRLDQLSEFRNGLNFTKSSRGNAVKIIGVGDFQNNRLVPVDELSEVTIDGVLADHDRAISGDIFAVRSNGNKALIGRMMMMPNDYENVSFSGFTIRIRTTSDKVLPFYLLEYLRSPAVRKELTSGGGGANISNLNQGQLASILVPLPDLERQEQIVREVSSASDAVSEIESSYKGKLKKLSELRQSFLQKAFSGELS